MCDIYFHVSLNNPNVYRFHLNQTINYISHSDYAYKFENKKYTSVV